MRKKLWDGWEIVEKIGEGQSSEVYKATKVDKGMNLYCAIKHVSLPKSDAEIEQLLKNGTIKSKDEVMKYYSNLVEDLKKEILIMKKFEGNCYIIDCYDYFQDNRKDNSGIDFYVRMELAEDIEKYFATRKVTPLVVTQLGIDICHALELIEKEGNIHKDIKFSNIYIGTDGKFKLGDFNTVSSLNSNDDRIVGTYYYMSPEVYFKKKLDFSTDLYSLGIVMYKLLNHGKFPFVNFYTNNKKATEIRMMGLEIPDIKGVNKELMRIVKKACSFEHKDRYHSALDMRKELEEVSKLFLKSNSKKDENNKNVIGDKTVSIYEADDLEKMIATKPKKIQFKAPKVSKDELIKKIKNIDFKDKKKLSMIVLGIVLIILLLIVGCSLISNNKSCDSGYVNKNGKCVKGYYYCTDGYVLNKDNKCSKTTESIDAKVTYSCKKDYALNGEECVRTDTTDPVQKSQCLEGFTLKDGKCVKESMAEPNISLSCSSGYTLIDKQCVKAETVNASSKYKCSDSKYTLSGTQCSYTYSSSSYITRTCSTGSYSSSKGCCVYKYSYGMYEYCIGYPNVGCSKGTYKNNTCVITDTVSASLSYYCSSSDYTLVGNQCIKTYTKNPSVSYSCSSGFTLKGNVCVGAITSDPITGPGCPDDYMFTGSKCVLNDSVSATKKYSCSKLYTLNGDKCEKYELKNPKIQETGGDG